MLKKRIQKKKKSEACAEGQNEICKELTVFQKAIGNFFSIIIVLAIVGFIIFAGYHIFEMLKGFMFP